MEVKEVDDRDDDAALARDVAQQAQEVGRLQLAVRRLGADAQRVDGEPVLEAQPVAALAERRRALRIRRTLVIGHRSALGVRFLGHEARRGAVCKLEARSAARAR